MRTFQKLLLSLSLLAFSAGCSLYHYPVNAPLNRYDPDFGYKPKNIAQSREASDLLLLVTFSGGGTRAAAFSYGVLEALRDTRVPKEAGSSGCWMRSILFPGFPEEALPPPTTVCSGTASSRILSRNFLKKISRGILETRFSSTRPTGHGCSRHFLAVATWPPNITIKTSSRGRPSPTWAGALNP